MFQKSQIVDCNSVVAEPIAEPIAENFEISKPGFRCKLNESDFHVDLHVQNHDHVVHSNNLDNGTITVGFTMHKYNPDPDANDGHYRVATAYLNIEQARDLLVKLQKSLDEEG